MGGNISDNPIIRLKNLKKDINLKDVKGGIRRSDMKTEAQKALFDYFNTNKNEGGNEVLDAREMEALLQTYAELAQEGGDDNVVSNKDGKNLLKKVKSSEIVNLTDAQWKNIEGEDVIAFLDDLNGLSANIESSEVGDELAESITTYKDGSIETLLEDGTSIVKKTVKDAKTGVDLQVEEHFDKNGKLTGRTTKYPDSTLVEEFKVDENGNTILDANGHPIRIKSTNTNADGKSVSVGAYDENGKLSTLTKTTQVEGGEEVAVVSYQNGKLATKKSTTTIGNEVEVKEFSYDSEGKPQLKSSKKTVDGTVVESSSYKYEENGDVIETLVTNGKQTVSTFKKMTANGNEQQYAASVVVTEDLGGGKKRVSTTENALDGSKKQTITEDLGDGKQRVTSKEIGTNGVVKEKITDPKQSIERTTQRFQIGDKPVDIVTSETITAGKKTTTKKFDPATSQMTETVINGNTTTTTTLVISKIDDNGQVVWNRSNQEVKVGGKKHTARYDGQGNTIIVVQDQESVAQIAKRFGCTKEQLFKLNPHAVQGKGKNRTFAVGQEILVPGEHDANNKFVKNRLSSQDAQTQQAKRIYAEQQKAERARKEKEEMKQLGIVNRKNAGRVITKANASQYGLKHFAKGSEHLADKTFVVVGSTGVVERNLVYCKENKKYYTMAKDGALLEESYVKATNAFHRGQAASRDDGRGRKTVVVNGKEYIFSHDGKILNKDYVEATDIYDGNKYAPKTGSKQKASDGKHTLVVTTKKNLWVVNDGSKQVVVDKQQRANVVNAHCKSIADDIYNYGSGTVGTDETKFKKALSVIDCPEIMNGVNNSLSARPAVVDYSGGKFNNVESIIFNEWSYDEAVTQVNTLKNNGAYGVGAEYDANIGRVAAGVLHVEVTGATGTADVKTALRLVDTPGALTSFDKHCKSFTDNAVDEDGYAFRQYLLNDGWNTEEVDRFTATFMQTGALQEAEQVFVLDENGAVVVGADGKPVMQTKLNNQTYRNQLVTRLCDYGNEESFNIALESINSDENSADMKYFESYAAKQNEQKGYTEQVAGQRASQTYIAARNTEDGVVNSKKMASSNSLLYNKTEKPADVLAEQSVYEIREGNYSNVFGGSRSDEYYVELQAMCMSGGVAGCENLQKLYEKASNDPNVEKNMLNMSAIASGYVYFSEDQIVDMVVDAMAYRSNNLHTMDHKEESAALLQQIDKVVAKHPELEDKIAETIHKRRAEFNREVYRFAAKNEVENTANIYSSRVHDVVEKRGIFTGEAGFVINGELITDPTIVSALTEQNLQVVKDLKNVVAEMEREFENTYNKEGGVTSVGRSLYAANVDGRQMFDTEGDMRNFYNAIKSNYERLELAAAGKLLDKNGNRVSFESVCKEIDDLTKAMSEKNQAFANAGSTAKMTVILAPVIGVTTFVSGGTAALGWGTVGVSAAGGFAAGGTTYAMNALEYNTSLTGNTAEAREANMIESMVAAGSTFIGIGQMKYISKMFPDANAFLRGGGRLVTTLASDVGVGAAGEYCMTGTVSVNGTLMNIVFSGTGNLIGISSLAKNVDAPTSKPNAAAPKPDAPTSKPKMSDKQAAYNRQRQMKVDRLRVDMDPDQNVVTPKQQAEYNSEIAFQPVSNSDRPAYHRHQNQVGNDYNNARQLGNMVSEPDARVLNGVRSGINEADPTLAGTFTSEIGTFTVENGKITKVVTNDGRIITDELKIAKFTSKNGVDVADFKPVKPQEPEVEVSPKVDEPEVEVENKSVVDEPEVEVEIPEPNKSSDVDNSSRVKEQPEVENKSVVDEPEPVVEPKVEEPEPVVTSKTGKPEVKVVDEPKVQTRIVVEKYNGKNIKSKEINEFVSDEMTDRYAVTNALLEKGYKPTEAHHIAYHNSNACVSMYNAQTGKLYTYMYGSDGKIVSKSLCHVEPNGQGGFKRISDLRVSYGSNGKKGVSLIENNTTTPLVIKDKKVYTKKTVEEPVVEGNKSVLSDDVEINKKSAVDETPEAIADDINASARQIDEQIPAEHKSLWNSIKTRLEECTAKLKDLTPNIDIRKWQSNVMALGHDIAALAKKIPSLKPQFEKLGNSLKALMEKAENALKSMKSTTTTGGTFSKKAVNDFLAFQPKHGSFNPFTIYDDLTGKGFVPTKNNTFDRNVGIKNSTARQSVVELYNPQTKELYRYSSRNQDLTGMKMAKVEILPNGEFKVLSEVDVKCHQNGTRIITVSENGKVVSQNKIKASSLNKGSRTPQQDLELRLTECETIDEYKRILAEADKKGIKLDDNVCCKMSGLLSTEATINKRGAVTPMKVGDKIAKGQTVEFYPQSVIKVGEQQVDLNYFCYNMKIGETKTVGGVTFTKTDKGTITVKPNLADISFVRDGEAFFPKKYSVEELDAAYSRANHSTNNSIANKHKRAHEYLRKVNGQVVRDAQGGRDGAYLGGGYSYEGADLSAAQWDLLADLEGLTYSQIKKMRPEEVKAVLGYEVTDEMLDKAMSQYMCGGRGAQAFTPRNIDVDFSAPKTSGPSVNGNKNTSRPETNGPEVNSNKNANKKVDPKKAAAYAKFDPKARPFDMPFGGKLNQNSQYVLDMTKDLPTLRLLDGNVVDLNSPQIKNAIKNLKEGEYITLGRNSSGLADSYRVSSSGNVSDHHILITKQNGKIQLKDVSTNGNTRAYSSVGNQARQAAVNKFSMNSKTFNLEGAGRIDLNANYILDVQNLPKLRLIDGTIIDLNNPLYINEFKALGEGGTLTLGQTGIADIGVSNNAYVSKHHILITKRNGKLIMKDVSSNGGTSYNNIGAGSNQGNRANGANNGNRAGGNRAAGVPDQNEINECKNVLGITEELPTDKEAALKIIQKAYRKKATEWHPDRNAHRAKEADEQMKRINVAKDMLAKFYQ